MLACFRFPLRSAAEVRPEYCALMPPQTSEGFTALPSAAMLLTHASVAMAR